MDPILEKYMILWADKANRHQAKAQAQAYCTEHEAKLAAVFADLTLEQMVEQVDFYRSVGREDDVVKAEMWLLTHFQPQVITGTYGPTPRERK